MLSVSLGEDSLFSAQAEIILSGMTGFLAWGLFSAQAEIIPG